jgi:signal transduction histidine kinase
MGSDHKTLADISLRVMLFRVIRELVYNIIKHAEADRATIDLDIGPCLFCVRVSDNGTGFDPTVLISERGTDSKGFGLFSIKEQLSLYGGSLEIDSGPGRGTRVTITISTEA